MDMKISSDPKIAKLYQDVPEEALERLVSFRERYPYQTLDIGGRPWRFIDSGKGHPVGDGDAAQKGALPLFILAGATTVAEVSFMSLEHFAQRYRLIAPDFPPIDTIEELFTGFIELLDHLGVGAVYAMGGSYGGWMVQSLVRLYPQRVRKMVISAVGPPNPENSQQLARMVRWMRFIPTFLVWALISRSFSQLDESSPDDPNMLLLWALVKEAVYHHLRREDILALLRRLIDQTENYTFSADDLQDWPGSILMVFGSEDPSTPPEKRQAMVELYPQAEMKVFEGGEHGIAISHQEEYFAVIDEFLAK